MKGILLGAWHSKGVTEVKDAVTNEVVNEIPYDNLVLCFTKPQATCKMEKHEKDWCLGNTTTEAKIPWDRQLDPFGGKIADISELQDYFGMELQYFYDDKKKLDTVLL